MIYHKCKDLISASWSSARETVAKASNRQIKAASTMPLRQPVDNTHKEFEACTHTLVRTYAPHPCSYHTKVPIRSSKREHSLGLDIGGKTLDRLEPFFQEGDGTRRKWEQCLFSHLQINCNKVLFYENLSKLILRMVSASYPAGIREWIAVDW